MNPGTPQRFKNRTALAWLSAGVLAAAASLAGQYVHAAAPAPDGVADAGSSVPRTGCSKTSWAQGPEDAELIMRLWIDPHTKGSGSGGSSQFAYDAWLQLRSVIVDRGAVDRFRMEVAVARRRSGGVDSSPQAREARLLFMALLEEVGPAQLLRSMTRSSGHDLEQATGRADALARLAGSLQLSTADIELSPEANSCRRERLDRGRSYLDQRLGSRGGGFPMIELQARGQRPRFVQDANSRSGEVRALLDQLTSPRSSEPMPDFSVPTGPKSMSPAPELGRTYPGYGILVGGSGLRHHLLVLADDERSGVLNRALPSILAYISAHPGRMSVQLLGVGSGEFAEIFTRRMCAARHSGLELAYLRYLSWSETRREQLDPDLGTLLDASARSKGCPKSELPELRQSSPGPDASRRGRNTPLASLLQSRDLWLDGLPSTISEIDRLALLLSAPARPLSAWRLLWAPVETEP